MRVSSPSSSSPRPSGLSLALVAVAVVAASVGIIVLLTGGFTLTAGPIRLSAHRATASLIVAAAALALLFVMERKSALHALAAVEPFLDRHATAIALVAAAAACGTAIAHGTYAAAGADAAGYVSEAALLAGGSLSRSEPLVATVAWPNAAWSFSPLGYRPGVSAGEIVPTYPAGLPLLMAGALRTGLPLAEYLVVPLLAALTVVATFLLGARTHSRIAGLVAATLLAASPIFLFQAVQPMSDVPATALWALALVGAMGDRSRAPLLAGVAAGAALLTRPNLAPLGLAIALAAAYRRPDWFRRLLLLAVGTAPGLVALALIQQRLYGSYFSSGYGPAGDLFTWAAVWPNAVRYGLRLWQSETAAIVMALLAGLLVLFKPSHQPSPRLRLAQP